MLAINIAKLAAAALIVLIITAFPKLATLIVFVIATPLKRSTYRVTGGRAASGITQFNYIKGILGELVNLIAEKF